MKNLSEWLNKIASLHQTGMELGLDRVRVVASRLDLLKPDCSVITVAGTNGKGSCVSGLETIYRAAGFKTGAFTSPILFRHNEYVRVNGKEVEDNEFCLAYEKIESARQEIILTPFEFHTLAAFIIFQKLNLDVWILEVGLGGRLDAVNILDADVAVVASIGIDHVDWLGATREEIAREKAGIFREGKPAVCGDFDPPLSLIEIANKLKTPIFCQEQQFGFQKEFFTWNWWSEKNRFTHLPLSKLALQNMSTVLMTVELLQNQLPVTREMIDKGLTQVNLPGRLEVVKDEIIKIFDVSHNPAAVEWLANYLKENPCTGKTRAVFSMLADKDIVETLNVIKELIDKWFVAALPVERATSLSALSYCFRKTQIENVAYFSSIENAYQNALEVSQRGDRIVVFGSFHTIASVRIGTEKT